MAAGSLPPKLPKPGASLSKGKKGGSEKPKVIVPEKQQLIEEAARLDMEATELEVRLAQNGSATMTAKLAAATRGTRAADLLKQWDADGDGMVSKEEFAKVLSGINPEIDGVDSLFASLDTDGSGFLETNELKVAASRLEGAANTQTADLKRQLKAAGLVRKKSDLVEGVVKLIDRVEAAAAEFEAAMQQQTLASTLGGVAAKKKPDVQHWGPCLSQAVTL